MATRIKTGDTVRVIAGSYNYKGKEGKVLSVDEKNHRVVVEGINKVKKHEKPSMQNQNGGIVEVEAPIDISNVMLVVDGKTTRVSYKFEEGADGKLVKKRYAKATGKVIDEVKTRNKGKVDKQDK
jgi:large subunit ribosomal protein L24